MFFLTQGKTNWKYILIIAILAVIVGGGILAWQYFGVPKQEISPSEIKPPEVKAPEEKFEIIRRIPEGTQSGLVEKDKVVKEPLNSISVVFNRDVDKSTFTQDHFYALWGINEKVPSRIEYKKSTKTASLVFDQEIQGGKPGQETRITVVIEGIKDLQGTEIERLLYNIDIGIEEPALQDETADWKTYQWNNLEFKYPSNWTVEKTYYQTPAQQASGIPPENIGLVIFPGAKSTGNDFIAIGGRQVSCGPSENHIKCQFISSISDFIYTDSDNPDIVKIFDQILSTFRFLE